tara:strand:- start:22 stop:609 length:588 start_codon:yes stop_codon:yes gene_type:complete
MIPMSPWSYLSMRRIYNLKKKYNFSLELKPVNLYDIFKKNKIKTVLDRPIAVQKNRLNELKRWSQYLDIPINIEPKYFPVDPIKSIKIIIASSFVYDFSKNYDFTMSICKTIWLEERDISDEEVLFSIVRKYGNEKELRELINSNKVTSQLKKNTSEAINENLFGVPSFVYRGQLFWGQDRIFFLEDAIKKTLSA